MAMLQGLQGFVVALVLISHLDLVLCKAFVPPLNDGLEECLQLISLGSRPFNETEAGFKDTETQSTCLQEYVWKFGGVKWADFNITEQDIRFINSLTYSLVEEHNRFKRQSSPTYTAVPGGNRPTTGFRIRREYRRLSDSDRTAFHAALNVMKTNGQYDTFANLHRGTVITTAHSGPNFFGWHRVYLALVEEALRRINRRVSLPYWDSSLDFEMDNPVNSILWSTPFLGNGDGFVTSGPFANWQTPVGRLTRNIGGASRLISREAIGRVLTRCRTNQISDPTGLPDYNLEFIHGGPHVWVGGQMSGLNTAAHDPAFFLLHSFIDYIWEQFRVRQTRRCRVNPETDYPPSVTNHGRDRVMDGFPRYRNIDGYQNYWTRNWYRYERSPTCRRTNQSCGSPYLRCDVGRRRCVSVARRITTAANAGVTRFASGAPTSNVVNRARAQASTIDVGPKFPAPTSDGRTADVGFRGRTKRAANRTMAVDIRKVDAYFSFDPRFDAPTTDGRTSDALGFDIARGVPSYDPFVLEPQSDVDISFPIALPMPLLPLPDFVDNTGKEPPRAVLRDLTLSEDMSVGRDGNYVVRY